MSKLHNVHLTRQMDLLPTDKLGMPITVIGAGAVGGWVTMALVKMGFTNIGVIDFDKVEEENLNSQIYRRMDIGKSKVFALQQMVHDATGEHIQAIEDKWNGAKFHGIVIAAVDSMVVRKQIWEAHKEHPFTPLLIDPRMGAETMLLYCVKPNDEAAGASYEKTLYSDENAVQEPCTRKSTGYTALILSGLICAQVKSFVTGNKFQRLTQFEVVEGGYMSWPSK